MRRSAAAADAARRLWTRTAGDTGAPEKIAVATEGICIQLRAGLGRWIGAEGYRALLVRALGVTRTEHPALDDLSCLGEDESSILAAVRAHGADEVMAGLVALVTTLIELLGRIIGEEMAVRLVEQIGIPGPRGVVSTETEGERHG